MQVPALTLTPTPTPTPTPHQVSCVPQSPHIFSGTLRDNLDPMGTHDDRALGKACEQVGVSFPAGLNTRLSANGLSIRCRS